MATIEGVINTMVTPFTKDGDVDYATFEKQVLFLLANGAKTLAYDACASGDISLARKLQFDMHELLESIQQCYPGGIKHAMAQWGDPLAMCVCQSDASLPMKSKGSRKYRDH